MQNDLTDTMVNDISIVYIAFLCDPYTFTTREIQFNFPNLA